MGLKLNTASSGSVTLEPANTASNYTLTVPAQTGTVVATDASGNVGIGTSSPSAKLDVAGSAIIGNTSGNQGLLIGNASGNSGAYVNYLSSNTVVNWQVGSNTINSGSLTFTPSTVTGGSTFTTPAGRFDSAGNFHFNSGYGSIAIAYGCRAWVNFNGTGTVAIRSSGNVTSITDGGIGTYTVNLTTALPDTNGSSIVDGNNGSGGYNRAASAAILTTTTISVLSFDTGTNNLSDLSNINVAVFR